MAIDENTTRRRREPQEEQENDNQPNKHQEEEKEREGEGEKEKDKDKQYLDFGQIGNPKVGGWPFGDASSSSSSSSPPSSSLPPTVCRNPDGGVCLVYIPDLEKGGEGEGGEGEEGGGEFVNEGEDEEQEDVWESLSTFMVVLPPGSDAFDEYEVTLRRRFMMIVLILDLFLTLAALFPSDEGSLSYILLSFALNCFGLYAIHTQDLRMISLFLGLELFQALYFAMHVFSYFSITKIILSLFLVWAALGYRSILQYTWYQTLRYPQNFEEFG